MKLEIIRKRLIKKLKKNIESGKIVIVPYSGGKDSHLAVIKLIEKEYYPILVYISLAKKNLKRFNSPDVSSLIRESFIPQIKLVIIKKDLFITNKYSKLKIRIPVLRWLLKKIHKDFNEIKEVFFYMSDNELIKKDKTRLKILNSHLKQMKIKLIKLSDLLKDTTINAILNEIEKYKLKAIIVNCDKELSYLNLVGHDLTTKLLDSIVKKTSQNKEPITNKIQTFVYFSPLFSKKAAQKLSIKNLITKSII